MTLWGLLWKQWTPGRPHHRIGVLLLTVGLLALLWWLS